jgi:hypothetical protein
MLFIELSKMSNGNKIETLTKIIGSTLLAGVLVFAGHSIKEYYTANRITPKIEFKEKPDLELEKMLELEIERMIEFNKGPEKDLKNKTILFNHENLKEVDFSRKKVTIDVYIDESKELEIYKKNKEKIFKYVSDFYKKMSVDLDIRFVDVIDPSALEPAKHLAIEIYAEKKCAQRNGKLSEIISYENENVYLMFNVGRAHIKKNIALACYCTAEKLMDITEEFPLDKLEKMADTITKTIKESEKECIEKTIKIGKEWKEKIKKIEKLIVKRVIIYELISRKEIKRNKKRPSDISIRRKAETITHELGHLFGLYHSNLFTNDPIPNYLVAKNTIPNYMTQSENHNCSAEFPIGSGFNDFQKRMVHSYLSRGKVYQQLEAVNFDFYNYCEYIKKANDYNE